MWASRYQNTCVIETYNIHVSFDRNNYEKNCFCHDLTHVKGDSNPMISMFYKKELYEP